MAHVLYLRQGLGLMYTRLIYMMETVIYTMKKSLLHGLVKMTTLQMRNEPYLEKPRGLL